MKTMSTLSDPGLESMFLVRMILERKTALITVLLLSLRLLSLFLCVPDLYGVHGMLPL